MSAGADRRHCPCETNGDRDLSVKTRVVVVLTSSRSVAGLYEVGDQRLSDALNNTLESVVRLSHATLGRLGNASANEPVAEAVVPKAQVALVYAELEPVRPVERRMSSYVTKQGTDLLVLAAGLRVAGRAHASAELDGVELHRLVAEARDRFVVLTDARLALDIEGTTAREIGVAMINSRHIQFVARSEDQVAEIERRAAV